jgi:hypothetical protein
VAHGACGRQPEGGKGSLDWGDDGGWWSLVGAAVFSCGGSFTVATTAGVCSYSSEEEESR